MAKFHTLMALTLLLLPRINATAQPGTITTIAGTPAAPGLAGDGGAATNAKLSGPAGIALDASGNVYVADYGNNRIRKITASGTITTIAGSSNVSGFSGDGGPATAAELNKPCGVAIDASGNVYFSDTYNNRIRRIDAATGTITTVAGTGYGAPTAGDYAGDGGPATAARFYFPQGLVFDGAGNLVIADWNNGRLRKIDMATGTITLLAGAGYGYAGDGGPATSARLGQPAGVALDGAGNIYTCDYANSTVRKIDISTGVISTVAGTGTAGYSSDGGGATSSEIYKPLDLDVDAAGNIYIADWNGSNRIRMVNPATGIISTVAGSGAPGYSGDGGPATAARLKAPDGVKLDATGNIYIADANNHIIRKVECTNCFSAGIPVSKTSAGVQLFPNPAGRELGISSRDAISAIRITDVSGRVAPFKLINGNYTHIDISALAPGIYFVTVNNINTGTFVKE